MGIGRLYTASQVDPDLSTTVGCSWQSCQAMPGKDVWSFQQLPLSRSGWSRSGRASCTEGVVRRLVRAACGSQAFNQPPVAFWCVSY